MNAKRILAIVAALGAAVLVAATASAASAPSHASLVIRHQLQGCHAWSLNGGAYKLGQTITIRQGGWITVTNNDVMSHKLVKTSGPAVAIQRVKTPMTGMGMHGNFGPATMAHMGATTKVSFAQKGVYRFTTKFGEDYMPMPATKGEDNVLRLTVTVS